MIKESETQLGLAFLERYNRILAAELGRSPVMNTDVLFMLGEAEKYEIMRYRQEVISKSISLGKLPAQLEGSTSSTGHQGVMGFIAYMRTNLEIDERHYNITAINQGVPVIAYGDNKTIHTFKATPVKMNYAVRYFTSDINLVNEFSRQWMTWFFGSYKLNFDLKFLDATTGLELKASVSTVLETSPSLSLSRTNRFEDALYYVLSADLQFHSLLLENEPAYVVLEGEGNIYQELDNGNKFLTSVSVVPPGD